jgi:hypothetical protein
MVFAEQWEHPPVALLALYDKRVVVATSENAPHGAATECLMQ